MLRLARTLAADNYLVQKEDRAGSLARGRLAGRVLRATFNVQDVVEPVLTAN